MPHRLRPRAQRFSLRMPILFRLVGEAKWQQGLTANISRTGVLFTSTMTMKAQTALEMKLVFPAEIVGQDAGRVLCRGEVVRADAATPQDPQATVAAAIGSFRMLPSGRQ